MFRFIPFHLTNIFFFTLIFVCEFISSEIPRPRGVSLSRAPLYDPEKDFTCFDGSLTIPFTQINDDYCDCPDASDEPGTSACPHGTFYCVNAGHQPKNIPSNRVNDGVCDCCDASDEFASNAKCVNNCEDLGRSAREEAQRVAELIRVGAQIRAELGQKGVQLKQEKKDKLSELEKNRHEAEQVLLEKEALKKAIEEEETQALEHYRQLELERKRLEAEETGETQEAEESANDQENIDEKIERGEAHQEKQEGEQEEEQQPQEDLEEGGEELDHGEGEHAEHENEPEDEEDEEEDSSVPATEPPQLVYDEETQKLVERANEARREFETAKSAVHDITREIDAIKDYLEKDFGPDEEFAPLEGQCFEYNDREYIYKLCPFDKTIQQPKSSSSETRLGTWTKWDGPSNNKYEVMVFENGQTCWNGPARSTHVKISCGSENKILSVTEPNRCEYFFEFATPAACREVQSDNLDLHDEL